MAKDNIQIPKIIHQIFIGDVNLTDEIKENSNFYFDHSYYFKTDDEANILCTSNYVECFASGVINKNIIGLQFHPEKSHDKGLKILNNFYNNIYA